MSTFNESTIDDITYKAWVNVDKTTLEAITKSPEDFVETLINKLLILKCHDFIEKQQASFFESLKNYIKPGEIIVLGILPKIIHFSAKTLPKDFIGQMSRQYHIQLLFITEWLKEKQSSMSALLLYPIT